MFSKINFRRLVTDNPLPAILDWRSGAPAFVFNRLHVFPFGKILRGPGLTDDGVLKARAAVRAYIDRASVAPADAP